VVILLKFNTKKLYFEGAEIPKLEDVPPPPQDVEGSRLVGYVFVHVPLVREFWRGYRRNSPRSRLLFVSFTCRFSVLFVTHKLFSL
jgi:hypothetical protein